MFCFTNERDRNNTLQNIFIKCSIKYQQTKQKQKMFHIMRQESICCRHIDFDICIIIEIESHKFQWTKSIFNQNSYSTRTQNILLVSMYFSFRENNNNNSAHTISIIWHIDNQNIVFFLHHFVYCIMCLIHLSMQCHNQSKLTILWSRNIYFYFHVILTTYIVLCKRNERKNYVEIAFMLHVSFIIIYCYYR